jgi:hypothetical protein
MMSSCMTKLEFPPEPYMLFRLEKFLHICCLLLHWVLSSFVDLYERFALLLKSRSRTLYPHMHCSYNRGRSKNMSFHLDPPKNVLLLHWELTPKKFLIGFIHQINALNSCCYLSKVLLQKRDMGLCKSYS